MKIAIVLLLLFLSHCQGTEYYVRPTELANASCADHPCLTLSQYIRDSYMYYKSNTVFRFLPGLYRVNETFKIWRMFHWKVSKTVYTQ